MSIADIPIQYVGEDIQDFPIDSASSNSSTSTSFVHHGLHGEQSNLYELTNMWFRAGKSFPPLQGLISGVHQFAVIIGVEESIVWVLFSVLVVLFVYRVIFRTVFKAIFRNRRDLVLLIGLPSSGKTALLSQIAYGCVPSTQTSIQSNRLKVEIKKKRNTVQRTIVDHPGHQRLRGSLPTFLASTHKLVVVINSITIHNDFDEGAHALADLLVVVFQSPAFVGVKAVLFACTKRDEPTSYSAKAVQKLLEGAMAKALVSRKGDLDRVKMVMDSNGKAIGKVSHSKNTGRGGVLQVDKQGCFSFDQLGVPYRFVEISSFPNEAIHPFNVKPVLDFVV
ncbi:unnamed protein product [Phytomonas sp. Hart1]|nr:unnamed protein product [Phytomonas sp. Hart1]|eukprot:CCW69323.1 unnamed protein product [Phytomonas sp. isolate Hart1]